MKEKIKNLFRFLGRAWTGGWRGRFGILMACIAIYMFAGLFLGNVSIQKFISYTLRLNAEQAQLLAGQNKLNTINRHIELLQGYSADYVEELGLKYLNIGAPEFKVLKI